MIKVNQWAHFNYNIVMVRHIGYTYKNYCTCVVSQESKVWLQWFVNHKMYYIIYFVNRKLFIHRVLSNNIFPVFMAIAWLTNLCCINFTLFLILFSRYDLFLNFKVKIYNRNMKNGWQFVLICIIKKYVYLNCLKLYFLSVFGSIK